MFTPNHVSHVKCQMSHVRGHMSYVFFNRPGVAGALLQTPPSLINSVIQWWFVEIYSKWYNSQTIRAKELKFGVNVHLPKCVACHVSHVTCHVSCVTCHVSHVMCHMSHVTCKIFFYSDKVVRLIGGGSVINEAYPV